MRIKNGIRAKLIVGGLLLVVVPMAVLGFISSRKSIQAVEETGKVQALRTATGLAESVELVLAEQVRIVSGLSENFRSFGGMDFRFYGGPDIDGLTSSRLNESIVSTLEGLGSNYESIFLTDAEGFAFAGALRNGETPFYGEDISDTPYFAAAMETGQPTSSSVTASSIDRMPVIIFCAPIRDKGDYIAGTIGMTLRLDALSGLVTGTEIGQTGFACMVDDTGTIIAHVEQGKVLQENIHQTAGMEKLSKALRSGSSGLDYMNIGGKRFVVGHAPVAAKGWYIITMQEVAEFKALAASIQNVTLHIGLAFLVVTFFAVFYLANLIKKLQNSLSEIKTLKGILESTNHFKAILDVAELGVWDVTVILDKAGSRSWDFPINEEHFFLSDQCLKMAGYAPEDLGTTPQEMYQAWAQRIHPEDAAKFGQMMKGIVSTELDKIETMYRIQTKQGDWKWIMAKGVLEHDPVGKTIRLAGVLTDVDSMVTADIEKQRAQQRFDRIVKDSHLGIFIAEEGSIRYANNSVERISGYTQNEIIGRHFIDFVDDSDEEIVSSLHSNRLNGHNSPYYYTTRVRNKAGKLMWIEVYSMPFDWEERPTVVVFLRDVTLEKAMEEKELHSEKIQAVGTLAGGIAHDFNNILSAIMGFTELCMMEAPTNGKMSIRLGRVMTAAQRARDLVKQILTFSRKDEPTLSPVNLAIIVKEVVKFIQASTSGTITIKSDIVSNAGAIMADPTRLHQVVMNLCTNAVHAMRDGGGVLNVTLSECVLGDKDHVVMFKSLKPGRYLHLIVSDTGHGMSPETIKNIFDPYFTTKPQGEGTGLGLSVAYGIIAGFDGAINVYSEEGKGSVFHVYLPQSSDTERAETFDEQRPMVGGAETILLVDDEEMLLEMTREPLEELGYTVVTHSNAIEAYKSFVDSPKRFDLVFTDYAMPGMTGLELTERIREVDKTTPIILCSGFGRDISPQLVADYGIGAVLSKPLLIQDITGTIRRLLD